MRSNIYYILFLLVCPVLLYAQTPSLAWALSYGNTSGQHRPAKSAVDAAGNLYVVGNFSVGVVDLDPGAGTANQNSIGGNSVSIQVFDPSGNLINSGALISQTAGSSSASIRGFEMDAAGNLYLAGDFQGDVDFDPTAGTNIISVATAQAVGASDNFVLKLNSSLNLQWVHTYGSFSYDNVYDLAVDASANVFVAGSFYGGADYDPTAGSAPISSNGSSDIFVQKFDANGNFQWVQSAGAGGYDGAFGVGTDAAGNVIVTGNYQQTVDFDPGVGTLNLAVTGNYDVFVWKLDASGNLVWAVPSTGGGSNQGRGVTTDASNNIYVGGTFAGTVDFDPSAGTDTESSINTSDADVFVWKLDANANHQWVAGIGANNTGDGFFDIKLDAAGNVYTVGYFGNTVDFDPSASTFNLTAVLGDGFVQELDANGNFIRAFDIGAGSNDAVSSIALGANDTIYTTGYYTATVDFDLTAGVFNLTSSGGDDGFITKYAPPVPGTALYLDGGNDEVVIPNVAEFSPASGEITYECWAIATAATWEQGTLVGHRVAPNTGGQVRGIMTNAGSTTISFFIDGAIVNYTVPNIQQWHHYAGTYDGATLRFYVDGVLVGQTAYAGGIANYTDDLRLGHDYCCGARFARAIIDEVRLWDYARCVTEIGAQKDCELVGNETGLIAYYDFNQGFDAANNSSETILLDRQTNIPANNGTLTNMTLNGASSNWVDGTVNGVSGGCAPAAFPEVAITEFIADPSGTDATDEWVEIHNYGATPYDLNGWRISDEGTDDDPIASASTIIAAGESYIIARNKTQFESLWLNGCPNDKVLEVAGLTLANSPDEIIIHDNNGCRVHQVAYIGDERVGRATWYTEAYPPATRVWGTSAGNQIDRQGNDAATGTTGYEENSTTADPNMRQANGSSDFGSPLEGNPDVVDIVRGQALDFSNTDNHVSITHNSQLDITGAITIEAWIYLDGTNFTNYPAIVAKNPTLPSGSNWGYMLDFWDSGQINLYMHDANASWVNRANTIAPSNQWVHIAATYDGVNQVRYYMNGVPDGTFTVAGGAIASNTANVNIGARRQGFDGRLDGKIDETRIWNVVRTEQEIRENMHLTLDGCETGLVLYHQMNEGSGITVADKSGNGNNGTLMGASLPIWQSSGVNVGNDGAGNSNSVTNAAVATGVSNFAAANLSIDFTAHSATEDICVTYEAFTPNDNTTGVSGSNTIDNPMWTVNKSTATSTQSMNMTFSFPAATLTTANPCELKLYNRTMGADGTWTLVGKASSATATTATFDGVTVTGQFMVVEDNTVGADIVRDQSLDFNGADDRVSVGDLGAVSDWTIETWFKPNGLNNYENIFHSVDAGGNLGVRLELSNNWGDGHLYVSVSGNGIFTPHTIVPLGGNLPNEWHHIAIVGDQTSNKIYVYLNGVKVVDANHTNWVSTFPDFVLGQGYGVSPSVRDFSGLLDEFRIWKTIRTEAEVRENMHLTLDGCETGLAAYYQMNEGSGTTIIDKSGNGNNGVTVGTATPTWVPSGVNVGNDATGNSNSVTLSVPTGGSAQSFGAANLIMEFIEHSATEDFTATYQEFTPNVNSGIPYTTILDNPTWTVNKATSTSGQTAHMTFSFPAGPFTNMDGSKYRLYWRPMNGEGNWSQIAAQAEVLSASAIKFTRIQTTGQFMVVQASDFDVTDVRGEMYSLNGTQYLDHTATATGLPQGNGARTIETWVKTTQGSIGNMVSWGTTNPTERNSLAVRTGKAAFIGYNADLTGTITINNGEWHHIVVTYDGSVMSIYVDGVLDVSSNLGINTIGQNLIIGDVSLGLPGFHEYYNGSIDEIRIWNNVRSEAEIRENMHLTLKGDEPGLISYYQFNKDTWDGSNHTVIDAKGLNNGTSVNMAENDRVASEVAVAGGVSQTFNVILAGQQEFIIPGVTIDFGTAPMGDVVVSRLETEKPTGWSAVGADVDNEYFVVWNYGSDQNPVVNGMTFKNIGYIPTTANTTDIDLYKRGSREYGPTWATNLGNANTMTTGAAATVDFAGTPLTTGFSQFVVVGSNNTDLPIELLAFEAERINAGEVELDWFTASELNNKGFEIERMLDGESEFRNVGFVEGAGTTLETTNYQYTDENAFEGVSYYRLKQLDEGGHFEYSETRAVFGEKAVSEIAVYPNPTKDIVNVRFSNLDAKIEATIELLDAQGQLIHKSIEQVNSQELLTISEMNSLPSGLYMLSIRLDNGSKLMKKIVKK